MNSVIIDIGLLRYILNSKCKIISIYLITWFHEQRNYRYWTNTKIAKSEIPFEIIKTDKIWSFSYKIICLE